MRIEHNAIFDDRGRALVKILNYNDSVHYERTPACTIGEYFAALTWLMEHDGEFTAE